MIGRSLVERGWFSPRSIIILFANNFLINNWEQTDVATAVAQF